MIPGNPVANYSLGTQVNRYLDALGLPDAFGDKIGALVDLRTGNIPGAVRNLVDLNSGLSTRQMDAIFGGRGRIGFGRAFSPRRCCTGIHLAPYRQTYTVREQVGKRAHIGQTYGYNWGPFKLQGRITSCQYNGSFCKPIKLADGDFLYRGRKYDSLGDIYRDRRDGRVDGQATTRRTRTVWRPTLGRPNFHPAVCWQPGFNTCFNPIPSFLGAIGGIVNGVTGGANGANGSNGSTGSTGSTGGSSTTGSVLSDPNLSLEDKLALLMAKLSEHMDKQIEEKMGAIEKQMAADKKNGSNGSSSSTGGSTGGTGSSTGTNGSNLQLLQTQLQQLLQKRQQMFQTMSNVIKSLHDTSMNTIRQLKA